jgi:hypothetical protein
MTNEEIMNDRYYEQMQERNEVKVPFQDYRDLEDKYDELEGKVKDLIEYIKNDDIAGAYEYAVSEGLI